MRQQRGTALPIRFTVVSKPATSSRLHIGTISRRLICSPSRRHDPADHVVGRRVRRAARTVPRTAPAASRWRPAAGRVASEWMPSRALPITVPYRANALRVGVRVRRAGR
jgi:hypothetical protein